jgi:hypothetical protein
LNYWHVSATSQDKKRFRDGEDDERLSVHELQ